MRWHVRTGPIIPSNSKVLLNGIEMSMVFEFETGPEGWVRRYLQNDQGQTYTVVVEGVKHIAREKLCGRVELDLCTEDYKPWTTFDMRGSRLYIRKDRC